MNLGASIKYLSYPLSENTPLYGGGSGISITPANEMARGDSCNTLNLNLSNHSGTHIDFPVHFNNNGKTLSDYSPGFWVFDTVEFIDLTGSVNDCDIIDVQVFPKIINEKAELLLIKTGWGVHRGTDRFNLTPPGFSHKLAEYFRKAYPRLRCVGMDIISISGYCNRPEGRLAHKSFLSPDIGEPILLIEDMNLEPYQTGMKVIVAPLLIKDADGAPCTVMAFEEL
jgi:arylformamidase